MPRDPVSVNIQCVDCGKPNARRPGLGLLPGETWDDKRNYNDFLCKEHMIAREIAIKKTWDAQHVAEGCLRIFAKELEEIGDSMPTDHAGSRFLKEIVKV